MRYISIDISTSGDTTIYPFVAGRFFRVLSYTLTSDTAMTFKWKSGTNDISGAMSIAASGSIVVPFGPISPLGLIGNLQTNFNEDLIIETSSAGNLTGHLVLIESVA